MKSIQIYTDGACSGNPGPGGWGAVLIYCGREKELSGYETLTTNNRMEQTAVIKALEAIKEPCFVDLYTDSAYVCNAFNQKWLEKWQLNGWKNSRKEPVENQDLWLDLLSSAKKHAVTFHKVKGHSDNAYNNRCDALARNQIATNRSRSSN